MYSYLSNIVLVDSCVIITFIIADVMSFLVTAASSMEVMDFLAFFKAAADKSHSTTVYLR